MANDPGMRGDLEMLSLIAQEAIMGIATFSKKTEDCLFINRLAIEMLEMPLFEGSIPLKLEELMGTQGRPGFARGFSRDLLMHEGLYQDILIQKKNGYAMVTNIGIKQARLASGDDVLILMFQDIKIHRERK